MNWFQRLKTFFAEEKGELKRTSWPPRKEVEGTTLVVIVTVFIFAFFLWIVDTLLFHAVDWIFKHAG